MELKEGMYVRFKDKRGNTYIRKVVDGYKEHWYGCMVDKEANNVPYVSNKNIINYSFNIIDLVQVGDYVNGYKVSFIDEGPVMGKYVQCDYPVQEGSTNHYRFYEKEIHSIVTEEQFENMKYRLGE